VNPFIESREDLSQDKRNSRPEPSVDDFLMLFLEENRGHDLLTAAEEVELAKLIEAGREATQQLKDPNLPEAEKQCWLKVKERARAARAKLVQSNVRLVISIAKRYRGQGVDFLDLVQEGNIGLLTAVEKFDYTMGNRFSTYATWWIRQSVSRAIANHGRLIRIPANKSTLIRNLYLAQQELEQRHGRKPTNEELALHTGFTLERVRLLKEITQPLLSLEQPAGPEDTELGSYLEDNLAARPGDAVAEKMLRERIDTLLDLLSPREMQVLCLRYGLRGNETHTLKEVGQMFELSRERIRQIEKSALRKLRQPQVSGDLQYCFH
jgi:RNA polymerase primary sigma factor